jgi:hypothetical protein
LYGDKEKVRRLPELLEKDNEIEVGKAPSRKANFTENYLKLYENTRLKKDLDQTETI